MEMAMTNSVFVFGASGVGKKYIIEEICSAPCAASQPNTVHLDTKYYRAELEFQFFASPFDVENIARTAEDNNIQCQAVILVHDLTNDPSYEALKVIVYLLDRWDPSVVISVGNFCSSETSDALEKAKEDALDRGWEFIDIMTNEDRTTDECGDKLGIHRIREALECNMWHVMTRKPQQKGLLHPDMNKDIPEAKDDFEEAINRVRAIAKAAATLPDDERREIAGRAAIEMWEQFMSGESDEDEAENYQALHAH